MKRSEMTCKKCMYAKSLETPSDQVQCRRNHEYWPLLMVDHWCGEGKWEDLQHKEVYDKATEGFVETSKMEIVWREWGDWEDSELLKEGDNGLLGENGS